jgi:RHS repeat-associated protein
MEYPMNQRTRLSIALCSLVVISAACKGGDVQTAKPHQQKINPVSLRNLSQQNEPKAWALFDRSTSQGFQPIPAGATEQTYLLQLPIDTKLTQLKVFGAAPYRLIVQNESGEAISAEPIDLSKNSVGWNQFTISSEDELSTVQLHFMALGESGSVAELEIWGESPRFSYPKDKAWLNNALSQDMPSLPPQFIKNAGEPGELQLDPLPIATSAEDGCQQVFFTIEQDPRLYRRAWISYQAKNLLRSFALTKGLNQDGLENGKWLAPAANDAFQNFTEELDIEALLPGLNTWTICLPFNATHQVEFKNLALWGELETGDDFIVGATSGDKELPALLDGESSTTATVEGLVHFTLARSVSPTELFLQVSETPQKISIFCARPEARLALISDQQLQLGENRFPLKSGSCDAVQLELSAPTKISEVALIGSGSKERTDSPQLVLNNADNFGGEAILDGFFKAPSQVTGPIQASINGQTLPSLDGIFARNFARSAQDQEWAFELKAYFSDGQKLSKTITLQSAQKELETALSREDNFGSYQQNQTTQNSRFGDVGQSVSQEVLNSAATLVTLGSDVGIEIPAGAFRRPQGNNPTLRKKDKDKDKITIKHLDTDDLPPLSAELINVTPEEDGFEFLPAGSQFDPAATLTVPYDDSLLPEGSAVNDIQTYFYDEETERWEPLEKLQVDVGQKVVKSKTTHFTIMINAVLASPDQTGPAGFTPTDLSSIAAADPGAGIDFVAPPSANSSGDANVSFPMWVPSGRGGYSPSLGLSYSSGGGSGWVANWDLRVSSVQIDTRYGTPRYLPNEDLNQNGLLDSGEDLNNNGVLDLGEQPIYSLDGQMLVPVPKESGISNLDPDEHLPKCSDNSEGERYQPRVEGSFFYILRCGNAPFDNAGSQVYKWEVLDRSGTRYFYGKTAQSRLQHPLSAESYNPGKTAVFAWYLEKVVDVDGNTTDFTYFKDGGDTEDFVQIYPQQIDYTSHPGLSLAAKYSIHFILDNKARPDQLVSGRAGFLVKTRHLLREVDVRFDNSTVRNYVLTYEPGDFKKTRLKKIQVLGSEGSSNCDPLPNAFIDGCLTTDPQFFYEHTFEYYSEDGVFGGFGEIQTWNVDAENPVSDAALNQSRDISGDLSLYAGFAAPVPYTQFSAGLQATGNLGLRQERIGFYDVNGDGLADIFNKDSDGTHVVMNQFDALSSNCSNVGQCYFASQTPPGDTLPGELLLNIVSPDDSGTLDELGRDIHKSVGVSIQGAAGPISGSIGGSYGVSTSRQFMTDVNGDGFLDQMQDERVLLSRRCDEESVAKLCYEPAVFTANSTVDISNDPDLQAVQDQLAPPILAPIRKWTAPFDGEILVNSTAKLLHVDDDVANRDGVLVTLLLYHPPTDPNNADDVGTFGFANVGELPIDNGITYIDTATLAEDEPLHVSRGDVILLRVSTRENVPYDGVVPLDEVQTTLNIAYTDATSSNPEDDSTESISPDDQELKKEPTGSQVYVFDAQKDFRLSGSPATVFQAPMTGTIVFHNEWTKVQSSDDLRACIQKFPVPPFNPTGPNPTIETERPCDPLLGDYMISLAHNTATTPNEPFTQDVELTTNAEDLLLFRLESDFPFDPDELRWEITADYTQICPPGLPCREPIAEEIPNLHYKKDTFTAYYPAFEKNSEDTHPSSVLLVPPSGDGQIMVSSCVHIEGVYDSSSEPAYVAIRSPHRLLAKQLIELSDQCPTLNGPSFIELVSANESLSFELVTPDNADYTMTWNVLAALDVVGFNGPVSVVVNNYQQGAPRPEVNKAVLDIFVGGFHGWGYGFLNVKANTSEQELARAFVLPFATIHEDNISEALQNALAQGDINSLTDPASQAAFYLMTTFFPARPKAFGSVVAGPVGIWEGPTSSMFISADRSHSAQLAEIPVLDLPTPDGDESLSMTQESMTEIKGVARVSATRSFSLSVVNFNIGVGRTLSKVDVLDIDGDGIVDSVQPNSEGNGLGRWVKGRLFRPESTQDDFDAPLEQKTSSALNGRIGSSFVTNFGASVGNDPVQNIINSAGRLIREKLGLADGGGINLPGNGSVGIGIARNRMVQDFIDINGDGLPDQVFRNSAPGYNTKHGSQPGDVVVRYNLGGYFSSEVVLGAATWGEVNPTDDKVDDFDPQNGGTSQDQGVIQAFLGLFDADENEDRPTHFTTNVLKNDTTITRNFNIGFASSSTTGLGLGGGVDAGFTSSSSRTATNITDINGDGLPDLLLKKDGDPIKVQYNLGDHFSAPEVWEDVNNKWFLGSDNLLGPDSVLGQDILLPVGLPLALAGTPAPLANAIDNEVQELVGPDVLSGTGYFSSFSPLSLTLGGFLKYTLRLDPIGLFGLAFRGGLSFSSDFDSYELALLDVNGDGAPEHVLRLNHLSVKRNGENEIRGEEGKFYVKPNRVTGKSNLLKKINRPLGGSIEIDYSRSRNTVDLPQSRYVMTRVIVDDDVELAAPFTSPNLEMTYEYEDGYFDRGEKEFFGFGKVISKHRDAEPEPNVTPHEVIGIITEEIFENRDYTQKGMLRSSTNYDTDGSTVLSSSGNSLGKILVYHNADPESPCRKHLHVLRPSTACDVNFPIVEDSNTTVNEFAENGNSYISKSSRQRNLSSDEFGNLVPAYDEFGNLLSSIDEADDASHDDDIYAAVTYERKLSKWIIGLPKTITVRAINQDGELLRYRSGVYDDNTGHLKSLTTQIEKADADTSPNDRFATTTFEYDTDAGPGVGNITKVIGPELPPFQQRPHLDASPDHVNCELVAGNQTQSITYQYEPLTRQFVTTVSGDFGLSTTSEYNPKFGVVKKITDTNGREMHKVYDHMGRLIQVFGPYDGIPVFGTIDGEPALGTPAIQMSYFPNEPDPRAITIHHISKPDDYNQTAFNEQLNDQQAQSQLITTVTVVDGLDRPIQVKKSATIGGNAASNDMMLVSAPVVYDNLGRTVTTFHPFTQGIQSLGFVAPTPAQIANATTVAYDVRGRVRTTVYPDNTSERMDYAIGSFEGHPQFIQISTDANEHVRKSYTDGAGRTLAVVEPTGAVTKYAYDALSELTSVLDASESPHETTMRYDLRGLRLIMNNPDTGELRNFYDVAGNLIASRDPNHNTELTEIHYGYDKGRLVCVDYPPSKEDVRYTYGNSVTLTPGQINYAKGRLASVVDESGSESYRYGKMGEVISTERSFSNPLLTFNSTPGGVRNQIFHMAYDSFGRQLSLTYPDGETVRYFYNLGGSVKEARGRGRLLSGATNTIANISYVSNIQYDKFGNKTHAEFSNGTVSNWSYDSQRVRLDTVKTTMNLASRQGNNIVFNHVDIQDLKYDYDEVGNPTDIKSNLSVPGPNNDGKIPGKGVWSFTYDDSDRLLTANGCTALAKNHASTYTETFAYDNIHNITSKVRDRTERNITGAGVQPEDLCEGTTRNEHIRDDLDLSYTYNPDKPHQVQSITQGGFSSGATQFSFDANGNMLTRGIGKGKQTYRWDDDNKLVEVTQGTTSIKTLIHNFYDADGLRAKKYSDKYGETLFVSPFFDIKIDRFNVPNPRATRSVANKHIFVGGWRVATELIKYDPTSRGDNPENDVQNQLGPAMHFHGDHLGSTGLITVGLSPIPNPNPANRGAILHEHVEYYADGDTWLDKGVKDPINGYRFSGKFFDPETGLYDFGARFYDPKLSLWLSNDPKLSDSSSPTPLLLSSYAYANLSPLAFIDPNGRGNQTATPSNANPIFKQKDLVKKPPTKIKTATRDPEWTLKSMFSAAVGFGYGGARSVVRSAAVGLASEVPLVGPLTGWAAGKTFDTTFGAAESLAGSGFSILGVSDETISAFNKGEDTFNSANSVYNTVSLGLDIGGYLLGGKVLEASNDNVYQGDASGILNMYQTLNDDGTSHFSVEIIPNDGRSLHTHLTGEDGDLETFADIVRGGAPNAINKFTTSVPNALGGVNFQWQSLKPGENGLPVNRGAWNEDDNNCFTYCAQAARASGLDVPVRTARFQKWFGQNMQAVDP